MLVSAEGGSRSGNENTEGFEMKIFWTDTYTLISN